MKRLFDLKSFDAKPVKLIFFILFIVIGIFVMIFRPLGGLDDTAQMMLGTLISALSVWIFRPGSGSFFAGTAIVFLGGLFSGLQMPDLAVGFSAASMWMLIPAMFLGSALRITGLGKRIVYAIFMRFNMTYPKILCGFFAVGLLFSLLTPSITVRILIMAPIAVSVADAMRLDKKSKERSLVVLSAWACGIFPGIAWLDGSLFGIMFTSLLPTAEMRALVTPQLWFQFMALPWILFSVVFLTALYIIFKPSEKFSLTKAVQRKMYEDLGPVSGREKRCLIAFVFLLLGLVSQFFIQISTTQVMLAAMFLILILKVMSVGDISTGINWDAVLFFGMILSLPHIFIVSGLNDLMSPMLLSFLTPIAFSPLLFVSALFGICLLLRFLDVSQGWIISTILIMAAPMLFFDFGLHPMIIIMVLTAASNIFLFRYHQPWIDQTEFVCADGGWDPRHLTAAALLYIALAAVTLVFSRFYWGLIGVI